tara:strand:- start:485 stop:934 length:450 start_codon:yes stop_codon:yes gene_type:complete
MSIKYQLTCNEEHKFEGWFPSIEHFENQLAQGQLLCPMCDSTKVKRDIMSPSIKKKSTKTPSQRGKETMMEMTDGQMVMGGRARSLLRKMETHVKENFENVGKNFPKEARKAKVGERNEEFYGTATKKEAKKLLDDGIDLFHIPVVKDN